mmetsp:Transcript_148078/g.269837  ORF Transcript_148078/g.269837 Transcript_148078/m.269837 type:complete len:103 (-) Transcript_148078:24-332(-)
MLQAFKEEVGSMDKFQNRNIIATHVHHWQNAWIPKDSGSPSLADRARDGAIIDTQFRMALCGDWVHIISGRGGNIQGAYLSGIIAAEKLAQNFQVACTESRH